jgi:hypothetical protein
MISAWRPPDGLAAESNIARKNFRASRLRRRWTKPAASTASMSTSSGSTNSMIACSSLPLMRQVDHLFAHGGDPIQAPSA